MHRGIKFGMALMVGAFVMWSSQSIGAGATITGTVKYDGKVPNLKPLDMNADPTCAKKHTGPVANEMLVLGTGNTMGNIFVQVKSGLAKKAYPAPTTAAVIDQRGCVYKPHVLGLMAGQPLKILNSDGVLHNVHGLPKVNAQFNIGMPPTRTEATQQFGKPEPMFNMKCDVHPWMKTWIAVMEHPFFAVTKEDGKFTISGLDAGTYEIEAWHEKLGTQKATVTVKAGESKSVDFKFTSPAGG